MSITATIIPIQDCAGNVRDVYLRGDCVAARFARLGRFMDERGLGFAGDWHGFQQPTFAESLALAKEYGIGSNRK